MFNIHMHSFQLPRQHERGAEIAIATIVVWCRCAESFRRRIPHGRR